MNNYGGQTNGLGMKVLVCAIGLTVMATVLVPGIPRHPVSPNLYRLTNPPFIANLGQTDKKGEASGRHPSEKEK